LKRSQIVGVGLLTLVHLQTVVTGKKHLTTKNAENTNKARLSGTERAHCHVAHFQTFSFESIRL
jgi:hypothetical protein